MIRFSFDVSKAIDSIAWLAELRPGITQYYIGKILFFADREHILDFGRPVTGDRYVAMEHGPVPSAVRDLLRMDGEYPDEIIDLFEARLKIEEKGNRQHVFAKPFTGRNALTGSDKDYLKRAFDAYADLTFAQLREISHRDPAYKEAWERAGTAANQMNVELWLEELEDPALALQQIETHARCVA